VAEALKRRTIVENTSIDRVLGVFSPEAEFLLATWMEQGTHRRSSELEQELEGVIIGLGLGETHPRLHRAAAAILMRRIVEETIDPEDPDDTQYLPRPFLDREVNKARKISPELLLSVCWESRPGIAWITSYHGVYLPHHDTYFVVGTGFDYEMGDSTDWILGSLSGKKPSLANLAEAIKRDWKKAAFQYGQPWETIEDAGLINGPTAHKMAESLWGVGATSEA
jgi:hypothetical protein